MNGGKTPESGSNSVPSSAGYQSPQQTRKLSDQDIFYILTDVIDKFECDESIRQWLLKDENMHTMSLRTLSSLQDGEKVSFLVHKKHLSGIFHDNNQPESPANTFPIEQKQYDNLLGFIQYKREQSATQEPGSVNVYLTVRKGKEGTFRIQSHMIYIPVQNSDPMLCQALTGTDFEDIMENFSDTNNNNVILTEKYNSMFLPSNNNTKSIKQRIVNVFSGIMTKKIT